jgi:hypothetical protein
MSRVEPGMLWKKTAKKAALSSGNVVSGAVFLAASAALWNPLPLILWGLGAASYVLYSTTSDKHLRKVVEEERAQDEAAAEAQREGQRRTVELLLDGPPFSTWTRRGLLPDYCGQYRRLVEVRDAIARLAHEREEVELATEMGIQRQLNYMLGAFLQFVKARVSFLQILAAVNQEKNTPEPPPPPPVEFRSARRAKSNLPAPPPPVVAGSSALPDAEAILGEVDARIQHLQAMAKKEPASAKAREWHVGILQKQKDLIQECGRRDQAVAAQLEAFPDAFNVVLARISAAQFDPNEVASTMETIVERVEETERFVRAFAPAMDQMITSLQTAPEAP